ncbi:2-dehydropantoate 2-reductase [Noviherbaspirillum sp. 1P10PC]|uniref:2-dehydropantoate 2-reductase n=1 Tax=Noviherbaspirillum sp. 1P10PC TaxID=3132292 RepID=UPI0039A21BB7
MTAENETPSTIAIFGAGSIGAFVGGALMAGGADVVLIGRARVGERIARHGLAISDMDGRRLEVPAERVRYSEDPAALAGAGLILVTVKSADTAAAAQALATHAAAGAVVVSLQNGIGNADVLRRALPGRQVLAGMVPFNVVQTGDGRFHRGTEGSLMVEASPALAPWLAAFEAAGLPLLQRADFVSVQWGKLLLNLNNGINALSGLPLKAQLSQRSYRRCLALLMDEALGVLRAAGIAPAQVAKVAPARLPKLLRLPNWLYKRLASASLRIDPEARSSMWEDLQAGRRTEIDYLNGAVVALAGSVGRDAPANRKIVDLVHAMEQGNGQAMAGPKLLAALSRSA